MPSFVRANGRLHHYVQHAGTQGRAVVFINSLGTDLRIWDEVIERLPTNVPVLSYDKSGHGLSGPGAASIEDFAADLASLMDALDMGNALVCGVSVGGMIAQALADIRPDLVAGLVLCNTGYRIGTAESWSDRIIALDKGGIEPMADAVLERWFSPWFRQNRPELLAGYQMMLTRTPLAGYRAVCQAIRDADLESRARLVACPTLCIAGEADLATPPDVVNSLADAIPCALSECYAGVGHLPCIEVPDRLASDIIAHLERLP